MNKKVSREKIIFICLLFIASLCLIFAIYKKRNYHVDELLSYTLANNWTGWMFYEEGVKYEPIDDYFNKQFGAQYGRRLKYDTVWKNQASDSHPPFFYALLHTVCSFSPEQMSRWQCGLVNIIFGILNMIVVDRVLCLLMSKCNKYLIHIIAFLYTILPGTIDNISFFRMYTVAMFWLTLVTYSVLLIKKQCEEKGKIGFRYWMFFIFSSFMGVLSHYYCAFYIVFINMALFVFFFAKRKHKCLFIQSMSSIIAAGIAILIFPAMLRQLFVGRGEEVQSNLASKNISVFISFVQRFFIRLNNGLFGGLLVYVISAILVVFIGAIIYARHRNKEKIMLLQSSEVWTDGILLFSVTAYFLLVSKVTVFLETRYIFPIYSVVYITIISIIYNLTFCIIKERAQIIALGIIILFSICSYSKATWEYLYLNDSLQDLMADYSDVDGIVIDDGNTWKCVTTYEEVRLCKSVAFFSENRFKEEAESILSDEERVIFCERDKLIDDYIGETGKNYKYLGIFGYFNAYYVY